LLICVLFFVLYFLSEYLTWLCVWYLGCSAIMLIKLMSCTQLDSIRLQVFELLPVFSETSLCFQLLANTGLLKGAANVLCKGVGCFRKSIIRLKQILLRPNAMSHSLVCFLVIFQYIHCVNVSLTSCHVNCL
jgi:hypothetical protein